ncbi:MAG: M48 family metallopeptidase [Proteobacteria bacterium]|nr:M48 family metallopeptidase [Pseudomonadota bacterium]MBU1711414.1 M48 family metallopeptidase [Pseudomonadota bacterium]
MELLLIIIFCAYLAVQLFENIFSYINLHYQARHGGNVPQGFEDRVDVETLKKMRDYTAAHTRVDFVASFFDTAITVFFIFGGLLNWYNNWITGNHWSFMVSGALFFLLISYGEIFLKLPFSLYNTFHVEQKFGFNTQTIVLWLVDLLKSLLLSSVLYGILLFSGFWIIENSPQYWWLILWAFLCLFSVFMMYISPYVIEPLFNKFSPIKNETLEIKIKELMKKAGISITKVLTMDASKRSTHSNAYFTGIGHVKRIILFDTLLENNSDEELLAILAHEAGHWKKKHILKRLLLMEGLALLGFFVAYQLIKSDAITTLFNIDHPTIHVKLLLVGFVGSLVLFPIKPLGSLYSRIHEKEADDFAVSLTGSPAALATALVKLGEENLSNLHPHPWYAAFYYSHPPLPERVKNLYAMATDQIV